MTITEDYLTKIIAERDARIAILELHCADAVAEMHHAKDDARRARADINKICDIMASFDEDRKRDWWAKRGYATDLSPPDIARRLRRILDSSAPITPLLEGLYNDLITTYGKDGEHVD